MRLKHFEYNTLVKEAYNKKRKNNELSPLLSHPKPGNIRLECAHVYQERYDKKDEPTLRAFFGPAENERRFLVHIQEFDVNKFKQLDKYLKAEGEESISDRNLELLAWLIDFQHRPYVSDNNLILTEEELNLVKNDGQSPPVEEPEENIEILSINTMDEVQDNNIHNTQPSLKEVLESNPPKEKSRRALVIFLFLIICTGGIYAIWQQKQDKQIMGVENSGCMYWSGDHYEPTPCNVEVKGRLLLPLNEERMKNFQRITTPDTITEKSIGLIYYISINAKKEYFTTRGNHPVEVTRNLQVLSRNIFDKYLGDKLVDAPDTSKNSIKINNTNSAAKISYSAVRSPDSCQSMTKKGTLCKRKAKANGYCWQHGG